MKSIQESFIQRQIEEVLHLNKLQKNIIITSQQLPSSNNEYYFNISISKNFFQNDPPSFFSALPPKISFILHLTHNYPMNPPRLFCLTNLSTIKVEICDAKDLLHEVIRQKWTNGISAREIILKLPSFLKGCFEKNSNNNLINNKNNNNIGFLSVGKFILDSEYDYEILMKIPNCFLALVDEVINERKQTTVKRFLMITKLFFFVFSVKEGYFSYSDIKLVFWASIRSIYGMKQYSNNFIFEFGKSANNDRMFLTFVTADGDKIMAIVLENLKQRNIDYLINENKEVKNDEVNGNIGKQSIEETENKFLPGFEPEIEKEEKENKENLEIMGGEEKEEEKDVKEEKEIEEKKEEENNDNKNENTSVQKEKNLIDI